MRVALLDTHPITPVVVPGLQRELASPVPVEKPKTIQRLDRPGREKDAFGFSSGERSGRSRRKRLELK